MSTSTRRTIAILVPAFLLVLAGVAIGVMSQQGSPTTSQPGPRLEDAAASLPACAEVFAPGKAIDPERAAGGCKDRFGNVQLIPSHTCTDGKRLWQVDRDLGAEPGYGRDGEPYTVLTAVEAAGDPGYAAAYNGCRGIKP